MADIIEGIMSPLTFRLPQMVSSLSAFILVHKVTNNKTVLAKFQQINVVGIIENVFNTPLPSCDPRFSFSLQKNYTRARH